MKKYKFIIYDEKVSNIILHIVKQDICIYMLRIAGQTAGPIGLKLFVDTHGWQGGVIG